MKTLLYLLMWPILHGYAWLCLKLNVLRHASLPPGPRILVANHPTTADPFFVAWLAQGPAAILITEAAFKVPLFGRYLRWAGHIPVVAGQGAVALARAQAVLETGGTVIIFPEGDLSPRDGFCPARSGAARLALLTGAPVVPVGIHLLWQGIREANLVGEAMMSRWPLHTPYAMTVGAAVRFHGDVNDRACVSAVTASIMHHIAQLTQQSAARLRPAMPAWAGTWGTLPEVG